MTTPATPATPAAPAGRSLDELRATVSASRLNLFHTCRLRFYFEQVAGLPRSRSAARHVGASVHHALKLWNLARWRREPLAPGDLQAAYADHWVHGREEPVAFEEGEEDAARETGWRLVETCLRESPIPPDEPAEGVEVAVEAPLAGTRLVGIIDLVRAGGRIVEFKTTATTPHPERAAHLHGLQVACYAVMYRESTGRPAAGIELHHLVKLKTPRLVVTSLPPLTGRQEDRLKRLVDSYLEGVSREDWVPSPGPMTCAGCEFFAACRRW